MESEEPYLRPCKQLPSPTNDRQVPYMTMGQSLGSQSSTHMDQRAHDTSLSLCQEDTEDDVSESEDEAKSDISEQVTVISSGDKIARYLKGKGKDSAAAVMKEGPIDFLDLPLDLLKLILKEVTHTNDLASCAKVNSTLHSLVTPMIYSRFDIVWPDTLSTSEPTRGVDALTYGLATLVMREDLFENVLYPSNAPCGASCQSFSCPHCQSISYLNNISESPFQSKKSRRGNYFSQFVKKFSLGNGPPDWIQEYLVTKESGKMLGTLVALSIARMPNLESFAWDMPTGILRDIWIALASLGDHQQPKLKKLWVRFHDNHTALKDAGLLQPPVNTQTAQPVSGPPISLPPQQQPSLMDPDNYGVSKVVWIDHHTEKPSFSIMPPMASLTVLEVDEAQYLEELADLIARSLSTLRELRIGMACTLHIPSRAQHESEMAPLFHGGVLSLLLSRIYSPIQYSGAREQQDRVDRIQQTATQEPNPEPADSGSHITLPPLSSIEVLKDNSLSNYDPKLEEIESSQSLDAIDPALFGQDPPCSNEANSPGSQENNVEKESSVWKTTESDIADQSSCLKSKNITGTKCSTERLELEVLEIERVTKLIPSIFCKAVDFTKLTSLTLLQCGDQSNLWDHMRKEFAPRITKRVVQSTKGAGPHAQHSRNYTSEPLANQSEYRLKLKRIHTDAVSSNLISFLKNTLAPNSLESLFLQDSEVFPSPVTLEAIYRGPIRRHRSSLAKVMIDSAYGDPGTRSRTTAARKWMLNRDVLTFVTSGRMCKLRELATALEYKDWHFFLQRIPNIPHLRSLYIPNMSDHPYGNTLNVKDFALSAIDVVALRTEVQLCYLGIKNKCFEILERAHTDKPRNSKSAQGQTSSSAAESPSDDDTEDGHPHDDDDDSDDGGATGGAQAPPATEPEDMDSVTESITSEDEDEEGQGNGKTKSEVRFKLREILFYDDKISIFKARHGRI